MNQPDFQNEMSVLKETLYTMAARYGLSDAARLSLVEATMVAAAEQLVTMEATSLQEALLEIMDDTYSSRFRPTATQTQTWLASPQQRLTQFGNCCMELFHFLSSRIPFEMDAKDTSRGVF